MADPEPAACKVLRTFLPKLAKTLDPSVLATDLHSVDIIDERAWEEARQSSVGANYDRCLNVLEVLIRSVRAKPECFDKFCSILEEDEVKKELAALLRKELKKEKEGVATQRQTVNNEDVSKPAVKRKSESGDKPDEETARKMQKTVKRGTITDHDRLFNDLAIDICDKYEEIGIELGIKYDVLRNELETGPFMMLPGNKKAVRMLQLWKKSTGEDGPTYSVLAAALEKQRLQRCAQKYCYTSATVAEQ